MRLVIPLRWWMAALGAAVFCSVAPAQAQARCPWLNVATASGMLGGPAALQVERVSDRETVCTFRVEQDRKTWSLAITVKSQQPIAILEGFEKSSCTAPGAPLRAIGNEAVLCRDDDKHFHGEQVVGRVRDSLFSVAITTSVKDDPILAKDVLDQKVTNTAEQVAGSLF
jgi:hypothetical protein